MSDHPVLTVREIDRQLWQVIDSLDNFASQHGGQGEDTGSREEHGAALALAHVLLSEGCRVLCREVGKLHERARLTVTPE